MSIMNGRDEAVIAAEIGTCPCWQHKSVLYSGYFAQVRQMDPSCELLAEHHGSHWFSTTRWHTMASNQATKRKADDQFNSAAFGSWLSAGGIALDYECQS